MTITNYTNREIELQARVKELEAQIEASRKQEAVGDGCTTLVDGKRVVITGFPVYTAPVITPDVKQYGDDRARAAYETLAAEFENERTQAGSSISEAIRALAKEIK